MEISTILLLISAGLAVGFINTLAGSGSLISLPVLIFLGLPPNVANGTNRIAILFQNIVGVASFKQQKVLDTKKGLFLAIPAVIGSVIGAQVAVNLNEKVMNYVIGGLLIFMFFLLLFKPNMWIKGKAGNTEAKPGIIQIVIFFFIGLYGGFIQAGVGFFLLAGLVLGSGYDLVKANALKVFIVLIYTIFALGVFVYNRQVDFKFGIIMALGNMLGAYIASKFAVKRGSDFVRWFLLAVILIASLKILGVFKLFF